MNKFDQDLYEFVTSVENFEPAFGIANKFSLFKKKLIEDFWLKVIDNIELNNKQSNIGELKDWITSDDGIIKSPYILVRKNLKLGQKWQDIFSCSLKCFVIKSFKRLIKIPNFFSFIYINIAIAKRELKKIS